MSYLGRSAKLSLKAQEKVSFLATAGQTSKTGLSYVPNFVEVYANGILLTDTTDFTATNGNSVTFTVALALNDEVTVVSLKTFTVADHYTISAANTLLAAKATNTALATTNTAVALKAPLASPVFPSDITVGGGVYLGGVGSSNKLDDYETGTWTPTAVVGSYTGTVVGKYTKVGRAVHITCAIQGVTDITTATGFNIGGLPFANASSDAVGSLMTRYVNPSTVAETGAVSFMGGGDSFVRMYFIAGTSSYHQVQHQHYTSSAVGIRIGITYFTT